MATIYYEKDVEPDALKNKTIAVLGFGSQGHAHALNLKESGYKVVVGLKKGSRRWPLVEKSGLACATVVEAVKKADVIMVLIPDELQAEVYNAEVAPNLRPGQMLMFAHGFSIHFYQIMPPANIDVAMIAPKSPGHLLRREYQQGRGVPALIAVHQDFTGKAKQIALAYASGIGATRAGVIETTFREEAETDIFGEQAVLCGGVTSLMKAGFETLVEAGYQPEMAYFECIHEMKLIVDLIYEGGFSLMRYSVSNTAEYGDYITQGKLITAETKQTMRDILANIRSGRFAKDWILESRAGRPSFNAMSRLEREHLLEKVGQKLRGMMPWLKKEIQDDADAK